MPPRPGVVERRSSVESTLRLVTGITWSCLVIACTPVATVFHPTNARATIPAAPPTRSTHVAPEAQGEVTPPVLVTPLNQATVSAKGPITKVRLSWRMAHGRSGQRSFVEVMTRGDHGTQEVYAAYVTGSYTTVRLPSVSASYVWRVYAMGKGTAAGKKAAGGRAADGSEHYAASDWGGFSVTSRSAQQ